MGASDFAAGRGDAGEDLGAVVIGDKVDRVAIGRKSAASVAFRSKDWVRTLAWPPVAGETGDVVRGVLEEMGVELGDVGDELAVG